ncbi:type V toxin-antitoxin system endoribonuclease antitoxin GhoS [Enterobacteriaceae bacterium YMB-R22]|uniref:type V toxin-antitoxin system endoribonuclease antitoxin GhoS n=1 Tax=Tenebrionicola larvae TaxID=2815733 RepID=UPI002011F980|nr:type V toxin-antitoxin system endoribonuclease antitoxin GhoS [Tenebrionicola larvae]MBV4413396.1 type V toxin-antitoxin system endoribonuclease antitoxin GhoS [Tenebrionicola larvae]
MSSAEVTRYIIAITHQATALTPTNEHNNELTRAGFTSAFTDEKGKQNEFGPGAWGLISALPSLGVEALARGPGKLAPGEEPQVSIYR